MHFIFALFFPPVQPHTHKGRRLEQCTRPNQVREIVPPTPAAVKAKPVPPSLRTPTIFVELGAQSHVKWLEIGPQGVKSVCVGEECAQASVECVRSRR